MILILAMSYTLQGCAGIECHYIGDSEEETKKFNMGKDEMSNEEVEKLREEKKESPTNRFKGPNASQLSEGFPWRIGL